MTAFDAIFFSVFQHYKPKYKRKANTIALFFVSMLQISLLLFFGILITLFLNEMNSVTIKPNKAWTIFVMTSIFMYFRNWMQYTGKKRSIINAKMNRKQESHSYSIWLLWLLLFGTLLLSAILLSSV